MSTLPSEPSIKILLVEDDWIIAQETSLTLEEIGYPGTIHAESYEDALTKLKQGPDLLLMDIDLGDEQDRDGIHLAARIQQDHTIPIIFLTQHKVSTFRKRLRGVKKAGYLTKDFNRDNLHAAIEVALDIPADQVDSPAETDSLSFIGDRFFLRKSNRYLCLHIDQLLYLRAQDSYCDVVFWVNNRKDTIRLSMSLKDVSGQINHQSLFRVHRSFAINLEKLTAFEGNMLFVQDEEIPVGEKYREQLMAKLNILGRHK
ncbi:MAG: response regulator transcription factor [Bacteroidota bacterium]